MKTVGLIGANGAGKSTIMKLLLGLIHGQEKDHRGRSALNKQKYSRNSAEKSDLFCRISDNQMFMPTVYEDMIFGPGTMA